jgi:hypothetical protein
MTKLIADKDSLLREKEEDIELFNEEKMTELRQKEEYVFEHVMNPEGEEESKEEETKNKDKKNKKEPAKMGKS